MSTNYGQVYRPLGSEDLHDIKYIALEVAVDFLLCGVQITLSAAAITILARRHGRSRFTLVAIIGLLLSSAVYAITSTVFFLVQFPVYIGTSERSIDVLLYRLSILESVCTNLSYALSDAVLVWRAWWLWPGCFLTKSILSLCMSGTVVGAIVEMTWFYWPSLYYTGILESIGQYLTRFIPLLTTNIVATGLIGKKVLHHRREIQGSLGLFVRKSQAEAILVLLLESGLAYILFWVVNCTVALVSSKDGYSSGAIFTGISHHIAGIYPTCVLFAAAGGTTDSLLSAQVSQAMRFADPPAAHEGAREADTMTSSQPEDSNVALYGGSEPEEEMHVDRVPGPSGTGTRSDESRFASSEGIIEVQRETTTM
ncbi:uncharacterized protein SCHCODRAFT_02631019 [Schizophyllum commune H4-8]|uniref:G-protein coupled receptors family 1 profile domain-containing protein n=1 Tax=Schizophyllum commune (strain H4-8 / FGSC 9210) TaxID=578458 RepID=D8QA40_SCHCM|nr:uncharacterized protein SCHCODRAFT_02631019 [Schizophyllum commune H4-8]KAI5890157.1 hypothetical protein SCHCODRAFT_02631019 [Schizophyllum commune H4-8]